MTHSWQRVSTHVFHESTLKCVTCFCQIFSNPPSRLPPTFIVNDPFNVMFLWLNGWLCHMLSLWNLVTEGPYHVFYATPRQVYWGLEHNVVFWWYSNTQTHSRVNRLIHSCKYILTPPAMCSQQLSVLY